MCIYILPSPGQNGTTHGSHAGPGPGTVRTRSGAVITFAMQQSMRKGRAAGDHPSGETYMMTHHESSERNTTHRVGAGDETKDHNHR